MIEEHGKQLTESNELIKNDFNIDKDGIPLKERKKNFMKFFTKGVWSFSEFEDLDNKIHSNNLIYEFKTEGIGAKDFRNFQNPTELFKHLRDGNVNPKEGLKNQMNFE